jgi:hypothetical protein
MRFNNFEGLIAAISLFSQPDRALYTLLVDIGHEPNLPAAFIIVGLIYANSIDPKDPRHDWMSQMTKQKGQICCDRKGFLELVVTTASRTGSR